MENHKREHLSQENLGLSDNGASVAFVLQKYFFMAVRHSYITWGVGKIIVGVHKLLTDREGRIFCGKAFDKVIVVVNPIAVLVNNRVIFPFNRVGTNNKTAFACKVNFRNRCAYPREDYIACHNPLFYRVVGDKVEVFVLLSISSNMGLFHSLG